MFRRLWIMRINAGARAHGLSYNQFISGLKAAEVELDRKVLADLAVHDPEQFGKLAEQAKAALPSSGRRGRVITSRDNEKLKLVRKLHERRWRDKLGLFVCEGEDLVAAATAEPVELLVAGENVEAALLAEVSTAAHPPRVIGVYRRERPAGGRAAAGRARALARRRPGERRDADPHGGRVRRGGRAVGRAAPIRRGRRRCEPRRARSGACRCCRFGDVAPQAGRARRARRRCRSGRPT